MTSEKDQIEQLQEDLKRARQEVFQLAKLAEMGKMVAVVAHELSQPLLGIKAFAQILRRKFPEESFIEPKVRMIEEQAIHMEGILASLRQYSRSAKFGVQNVDLLVPIRSAMELFHERARKLRIKVLLEGPTENLSQVRGNVGHLQQVMANLLGNALDELEERKEGSVIFRLAPSDDGIRVRVADTGGGVPADARERLFEPFFTTKASDRGTGLGLSICSDILRLFGGSIRLLADEEVAQEFGDGFGAGFEVCLAGAKDED